MRINNFVAQATGLSRRKADEAIQAGRIKVNGLAAPLGQEIKKGDILTFDEQPLQISEKTIVLLLHKPAGYVVSRAGQGSKTIYALLPEQYHNLKPVGRLDKESSGLLLMTNDGQLAHSLTHPSFAKEKVYKVMLDKPLSKKDKEHIASGVVLEDGVSKLTLHGKDTNWTVRMREGRNRQIRRTFQALGYTVVTLHRTDFGSYKLAALKEGEYLIT